MEFIIGCLILMVISLMNIVLWAVYRYKKLLAKYEIVVEELCEYLDDEAQEESEWGNRR